MTQKKYVIGAKIPEALNDELKKMMAHSGKSSSQVIRDALEYYIEQDRILTRLNAIEAQNKIHLAAKLDDLFYVFRDALRENNEAISKLFAD